MTRIVAYARRYKRPARKRAKAAAIEAPAIVRAKVGPVAEVGSDDPTPPRPAKSAIVTVRRPKLAGWWNARAAETPRWIDPAHGLQNAVNAAQRARRRMVFVVSQATQRARITAEAAILLSQYGTVAPVMVHHRVDFATSMTDGRTTGELDARSRSGAEIAALWTYLHNLLIEDERDAEGQSNAA